MAIRGPLLADALPPEQRLALEEGLWLESLSEPWSHEAYLRLRRSKDLGVIRLMASRPGFLPKPGQIAKKEIRDRRGSPQKAKTGRPRKDTDEQVRLLRHLDAVYAAPNGRRPSLETMVTALVAKHMPGATTLQRLRKVRAVCADLRLVQDRLRKRRRTNGAT